MQDLLNLGRSGADLLLVVLGFGFIIFIHELGHFVAAKWAGIRVLAFAIGFGPAALSYRKGFGWRRGSSEKDYVGLVNAQAAGATTIEGRRTTYHSVSPTEYRLNWLPLGGYVKMLGQDDLDPTAVSAESDSYQRTPVWKRMIVISAGVVMNLIMAAVLFVGVFMHGLETEPPVVGAVEPGEPAALAVAENAAAAGVQATGLQPGDHVLLVNGVAPREFTDLVMASAMSGPGEPVTLQVQRPGVAQLLTFEVTPKTSEATRLLEMGIEPSRSTRLLSAKSDAERAIFDRVMTEAGVPGVKPGMTLVRVGDKTPINDPAELDEAVRRSGGAPVEVEFRSDDGQTVRGSLKPRPVMQTGWVKMPSGKPAPEQHLLGLTPVLRVRPDMEPTDRQKLEDNDIFARIGSVEFPSLVQGICEVRRHRGEQVAVTVLRKEQGTLKRITIDPSPTVLKKGDGIIGFVPGDTSETDTLIALPEPVAATPDGTAGSTPAASLITRPGTRILSVAGMPVHNFGEIRAALRDATSKMGAGAAGATIPIDLELPLTSADGTHPVEHGTWTLSEADVRTVRDLGWSSPLDISAFDPATYVLKATGPLDAIRMGVHKANRVMVSTYLTFARLAEGTVKVEHLKGPVGIAHLGTRIAAKGTTWLCFFLAIISVNLAVINFLPLPIVDGGQFIFLLLEQIRGKPVSVEIQNVATVLGLVLIGVVFVVVTFHDITGLFTG